jgi:hypothetical protein
MLYMTRIRISCQSITAIKGSLNFGLVKEQGRLIAAIDEILVFVFVFVLVFALVRRDPRVFGGRHLIGNDVERFAQRALDAFWFGHRTFALLAENLALEPGYLTAQANDSRSFASSNALISGAVFSAVGLAISEADCWSGCMSIL